MQNHLRIVQKSSFTVWPWAREIVAVVCSVRRVELSHVTFEACIRIGNKLAIVMRTRIIAPAVNSSTMFKQSVTAQLSGKLASALNTQYLPTAAHTQPVVFAFVQLRRIFCIETQFDNVRDEAFW